MLSFSCFLDCAQGEDGSHIFCEPQCVQEGEQVQQCFVVGVADPAVDGDAVL